MSILSRTLTRRTSLKMAGAGLALPALGAAGTHVAAQDAAKLTLWLDVTGGSETAQCIIDGPISDYNDQGGTQVEATMQANGWTAVQTALAGGAGPDVVITPGPSFAFELAKANQLVALDDYATQHKWADSFVPWALGLGKIGDKLYSLPTEVETLVLYFNKTVFDEHGWTPPKTIEELMTLAETIDGEGIIPFAHGNSEWRPTNEWFVGEFLNHGAGPDKVYQALKGELKWTDQAFVDALTPLNQMQENGWFMGGLDRYYTSGSDDTASAIAYGDAAMKIEGSWFMSDALTFFEESGQEWDWVPMPSTTGDAIYDVGIGSTFSINTASKSPDAAAEFLTSFFSAETQAHLAVDCGMSPAPVAISSDLLSGLDERQARLIEELNKASEANNYGYTTWTFWPPKTEVYLYEQIEKVWAGDVALPDYLQGLQDLFDQEFEAGDLPPLPERS
ncbi:MAG TPA: extracellular solute-binding protein [Thermomicrobiales bacterium]|nr:extracellular solute-binding protein [Thermomicrobiales bacterium]